MTIDTELPLMEREHVPTTATATAPRFGAGKAFAAFGLLLAGQFAAGLTVILVATIVALVRGSDPSDPRFMTLVTAQANAPLLLAAGIISTAVVLGVARFWAWPLVTDKGSSGIGLVATSTRNVVAGGFFGAVMAAGYLAVAHWLVPFTSTEPLGPVATAAASGGMARIAWVVLALAFAPIVEELFFRGLLLSGFESSWGFPAAAVIVTILFVGMHIGETMHYWPASVAVAMLAVCTLAARRASGSLAPSMAMHGGYNLVIALAVLDAFGRV